MRKITYGDNTESWRSYIRHSSRTEATKKVTQPAGLRQRNLENKTEFYEKIKRVLLHITIHQPVTR